MSKREDLFFKFIGRANEKGLMNKAEFAPKELLAAFESCHPIQNEAQSLPTFAEAEFHQPFSVYVIRNTITRRAYVGRALNGFAARYPKGWWNDRYDSHVDRATDALKEDALIYGVSAFDIHITVCDNDEHAAQVEAQLIAMHRRCTYNLMPEPTKSFENGGSRVKAIR